MTLRRIHTAIALGLALASSGCPGLDSESCEVPTEEISALALVVDSGWDIRASIDFERGDRRGQGSPLRLCETDVLTINGQSPQRTDKADRVEYSVVFDLEGARSFEFVLDREAQGERLSFGVDLPEPFELLVPMDGDEIARGVDLPIEWEPASPGDTMLVQLREELGGGECIAPSEEQTYEAPGGVQVDDTGTWTIAGADLTGAGPAEACGLALTLARVALGDYPAAFSSGGRVEARVERYIDLAVTP